MSSIRFSIDLMFFFFLCVFERPKSWPNDQFILAEKFIHIDVDCGFRIFSDMYGLCVVDSYGV